MSIQQSSARSRGVGFGAANLSMALLVIALWLVEGVDQVSGNALDLLGIRPRSDEGLVSIFLAPWLHGGWGHLLSNTVPFYVLGVLVLLEGWRRWTSTTLLVVLVSGATVWLVAPASSITLGASGVVFGWLTYLVVRGLYTRSPGQIVLGVAVFLLYGGLLWGVLPTDVGVSWQAHLGGAAGGLLSARGRRRRAPSTPALRTT